MSMRHRWTAFRELHTRYRSTFAYFWRLRHAISHGTFNEDEASFLPAALSLQERPVSASARITARILMALVALLLLWSVFGRIDIIVNAMGKIIPGDRIKTIASVDTASVHAIHVAEGQLVKAGDVLVELDTGVLDAERAKAAGDENHAVLAVARATALISAVGNGMSPHLPSLATFQAQGRAITPLQWQAEQSHLDGLYRDFLAKKARLDGEITHYNASLPLITQRAEDYKSLLESHDVARHAWVEKEQARIDLVGQLQEAVDQRSALIAETKRVAYEQITEGRRSAESSRGDSNRSEAHRKLLKLTAPIDGRIEQLIVHTVGGVVPAAQTLMQIVPVVQTVEVEAFIPGRDVGFVHEGQPAEVKIDAFEYTKYGTIPATVAYISRDAVQDEKQGLRYKMKIKLTRPEMSIAGRSMPLIDGMSVTVDIKTGDRRLIEYWLAPLLQHQREALHER